MAVFSKRTNLLLLTALVLLSIALRYPLVEHERFQTDSYFVHSLSQSIVEEARARWTFHPLSYFGYYPDSYPSGSAFALAVFSILSGAGAELSILLEDMILGVVFCLGVFGISRCFLRRTEYALLASFLALTSARFVDTTYFNASARGILVVLFMLVILSALLAGSTRRSGLYAFVVFFVFGCFAVHHMAVLLALMGLAYILTSLLVDYLLPRVHLRKRKFVSAYYAALTVSLFLFSFGYFVLLAEKVKSSYEGTSVFNFDPPILSTALNIAISYTNQIGFVLPVAILGIPLILRRARLSKSSLLPIAVLVSFIPVLGSGLYISMLLAPFVAIIAMMWLSSIPEAKKRDYFSVIVVAVLVCSSILVPVWSIQRWNSEKQRTGDTAEVGDQVFNDATYLKYEDADALSICNTDVLSSELAAISGTGLVGSGVYAAINGDTTAAQIGENLTWSSAPFPENLFQWYEVENAPNQDLYELVFMILGMNYISQKDAIIPIGPGYFHVHSRLMVVIDNNWPSSYVNSYGVIGVGLPAELRNAEWRQLSPSTVLPLASYTIYESSRCTFYAVQLIP